MSASVNRINEIAAATRVRARRGKINLTSALVLSDFAAFLLTFWLNIRLWQVIRPDADFGGHIARWPLILIFPVIYAAAGLYRCIGLGPVRELRLTTVATSLGFLVVVCTTFFMKSSETYSRPVILLTWVELLVIFSPLRRYLRQALISALRCERRAVIVGCGDLAERTIQAFKTDPSSGVTPVAIFDPDRSSRKSSISGLPVFTEVGQLADLVGTDQISCCVIAADLSEPTLGEFIAVHGGLFSTLLIVPDLQGLSSLGVEVTEFGKVIGLEINQSLLTQPGSSLKRAADLSILALALPFLLPALIAIAIAIKVTSKGAVFYGQQRLGRGRTFTAWKFRTMSCDADSLLEEVLSRHPALRQEWDRQHKLRDDPRVTAVGRILRRFSLDELPQFWNVLRGDMSLVGPRPIIEAEITKYGAVYSMYSKVRPGLSGMWQVSGRSSTSYDERVRWDEYYVRNWSIWLDLYILTRTARIVLMGRGAY